MDLCDPTETISALNTKKMALLNWILLIALVIAVAHEQPLTSFTNGVLVFTNTTCAQVTSSWGTLVTNAKWLDTRILAWEDKVAETIISYAAVPEGAIRQALATLASQIRSNRVMDYMCH